MRLIDADALIDRMYHDAFETDTDMQKWDSGCWIRYKMFENAIDEQPTIEPKQGKWIHDRLKTDGAKLTDLFLPLCQCSECSIYVQYESNFCPHCGTRMKGIDE